MTNTYALTDYDVYEDEDYDNFGGRRRRRKARRRRRKILRRKRRTKPVLGRPPIYRRPPTYRGVPKRIGIKPKIVKGRPMRLPPIKIKTRPVPVLGRPPIRPAPFIKPVPKFVKKKPKTVIKPKTPINHLIKTTSTRPVKTSISKTSKVMVNDIKSEQVKATKKAIESDGKSSKLIKVVAIVGIVGVTGLGIYKFIKNKQASNGRISTN